MTPPMHLKSLSSDVGMGNGDGVWWQLHNVTIIDSEILI